MTNNSNFVLDSKPALPNKLLRDDGTITDITGAPVENAVEAYAAKQALPNKFLNPDGSYSTLNEIIASMVDTDLFIIVTELPSVGEKNKIYLVPKDKGSGFIEWLYADGQWDTIGEIDIDLSNYPTREEVQTAISAALSAAKQYTDANFLKKDNSTAFTPTGDYNPSTKKYVDDSITSRIGNLLGGDY